MNKWGEQNKGGNMCPVIKQEKQSRIIVHTWCMAEHIKEVQQVNEDRCLVWDTRQHVDQNTLTQFNYSAEDDKQTNRQATAVIIDNNGGFIIILSHPNIPNIFSLVLFKSHELPWRKMGQFNPPATQRHC